MSRKLAKTDAAAPYPVRPGATRPPIGPWERQIPLFDPTPFAPNGTKADEIAARIAAGLAPVARQVFEYLRRVGPLGATCDEAEIACGLTHQCCSARVHDLAAAGLIVDSGNTRATRSGRRAAVYVIRGTKLRPRRKP